MSLMNSFAKLNLRTKLVIGFSTVITFSAVISATAIYGLNLLNDNAQKMYDKDLIGISLLRSLNRDVNVIGRTVNRLVLATNAGDDAAEQKAKEAIAKVKVELSANYEKSKGTVIRPEVRARLDAVGKQLENYYVAVDSIIFAAQGKGGVNAAYKIISSKEYQDTLGGLISEIRELGNLKADGAAKNQAADVEVAKNMKWLIGVMLAAALVLSIIIVMLVNKSINDPITNLKNALADLASAKLDTVVKNTDYTNEIGQMAKAVAELQISLQKAENWQLRTVRIIAEHKKPPSKLAKLFLLQLVVTLLPQFHCRVKKASS
jgi:HAMP domain-containing protein